jgi:lipopolysaccharide biosynthesis glycosyltransferase
MLHEYVKPDPKKYSTILKIRTLRHNFAGIVLLTIGSILPKNIKKAICIDADLLLVDDIKKLWDIDLNKHPIAAVTNLGQQPVNRMGIKDGDYFNAGMLVFNIEMFRKECAEKALLKYMETCNENQMKNPDQDTLNSLYHSRWLHLPLRWNQQPATFRALEKKCFATGLKKREYQEATLNPAIVHFLHIRKPWFYMSFHPFKELYWHYLQQTPYRDYQAKDKTIKNMIIRFLSLEKHIKLWLRKRRYNISF